MQCEDAQQNIVLAQYGELPEQDQNTLEQHLAGCDLCRTEWNAFLALGSHLDLLPVAEPSPNLLAASRMRLDEALDALPPYSLLQRLRLGLSRWASFLQGAPALTAMLLGVGYLGGSAVSHFRDTRPEVGRSVAANAEPAFTRASVATVENVRQQPDSDMVEVDYKRLVPATMRGHLDDPEIRNLLMAGSREGGSSQAHLDAVALLATECRNGHACGPRTAGAASDGSGDSIRNTLLASLRSDRSPVVRLSALDGLQPYVAEDQQVRDALLEAVMHDRSEKIRAAAIAMLSPVGGDSTVRQALRTVSAEDANPAVRNASFQLLQSAADIQ